MGLTDLKSVLDVLDIPIKWVALAVGAVWTYNLFVKKRSKYPKADLQLSARCWLLSEKSRLVRVTVVALNRGDVLLNLQSCRVWIQQVRPLAPQLAELLARTGGVAVIGQREAEWPLVAEKEVTLPQGSCEIEPGESQQLYFDLVLTSPLETAIVYAYAKNEAKRNREIGWDAQTVLDVNEHEPGGNHGAQTESATP